MQLFAFALSRLPDPYAILLGGTIGMIFPRWWQAVLAGVAGGTVLAVLFGFFGGMSSDAPAYFAVDAIVVVLWSSMVFAARELLRRRKLLKDPALRTFSLQRFGRTSKDAAGARAR